MSKAPEFDMFKGHPVIVIYAGKSFNGEDVKFAIGYRKARAVCDHIEAIRQFVELCERTGDDK